MLFVDQLKMKRDDKGTYREDEECSRGFDIISRT